MRSPAAATTCDRHLLVRFLCRPGCPMRYFAALACVAVFAGAAGCGRSAYPSSPTGVSAPAAGAFDYYDDYPPPDPYDPYPPDPYDPYPPPPLPEAPAPGAFVVTPGYGPTAGGTAVTITGGGFVPDTAVMFGAAAAISVTVVDAATITAVTPASVDGWVDVVVAVPGGSAFTLPGGFTYADEPAPGATATITITPAGNTPKAIVTAAGSRIRVVNNDVRPHELASDPHPSHTDCPEAGSGLLMPGGSGQSGAFMTARTCGIHDHNDPGNPAWMSRIIIR
jgi:hypothetical protein